MHAEHFQVEQRKVGEATVLKPLEDIDSKTAPVLERVARARLKDGDVHLAVDLGRCQLVTSIGLAVFLRLDKSLAAAKGKMVLFGLRPMVREIFEKTRLDTVLNLVDDEAAALEFLRP